MFVSLNGRRPMELIHIVPNPSVWKFLKLLTISICIFKRNLLIVVRGEVL